MRMFLLTRRWLANTVLSRWKQQYSSYKYNDKLADGKLVGDIQSQLENLGVVPDPDAIDKIIGNTGWTRMRCTICFEEKEILVQSITTSDTNIELCEFCLRKALSLIEESKSA